MQNTWYLIATYAGPGNPQLIIEGFGPNTLAGAVQDVLEEYYQSTEDGNELKSITISRERP